MKHFGDQLTVGDLIDELKKAPESAYLTFEWGGMPLGGWESYRGSYDEIALFVGDPYKRNTNRVGTTLEAMNADLAERKVFVGYKGGDYVFTRDRCLWVSQHGETSNTYVSGVRIKRWDDGGGWAEILTKQEEE